MTVNINGSIKNQLPAPLEQVQRAVFYGDGLFEAIRVFNNRIPLLPLHWERLATGAATLGLNFPAAWRPDFFEQEIRKIATPNARVRLTVWRSAGGLYLPLDDSAQFMLSAIPLTSTGLAWLDPGISIGRAESVQLPMDMLSNVKTLNALRYIQAAREARKKGWDDALLENAQGRPCEATSSNVFWWENAALCTVPLSEACVAGVMRRFVLDTALNAGYEVQEKPATFAMLEQAGELFITNAIRGIVPVRNFAGKLFGHQQTRRLFDEVNNRLCSPD